jgi:hypothetical protein
VQSCRRGNERVIDVVTLLLKTCESTATPMIRSTLVTAARRGNKTDKTDPDSAGLDNTAVSKPIVRFILHKVVLPKI